MISEIGAILTVDETQILKDFIASQFSGTGSLTLSRVEIDKMQKSGVFGIYCALKEAVDRRRDEDYAVDRSRPKGARGGRI